MTNTTPFNEYEEFIYLNTFFDRTEARQIARYAWQKEMTKQEALAYAEKQYEKKTVIFDNGNIHMAI